MQLGVASQGQKPYEQYAAAVSYRIATLSFIEYQVAACCGAESGYIGQLGGAVRHSSIS